MGGKELRQSKRLLSVIIAFCFIIGCFWPIQANALPNKVTTDIQTATINEGIQTQNPQNAEADKEVMEVKDTPVYQLTGSGVAVTTSGQAIDVTITGSAINCTTTGSAISSTTAQGIEVKDENITKDEEN
jgi:hypothetical protein